MSFREETHQHIWDGALMAHPGNLAAGTREVIRHTTHLGQRTPQAPDCLSCSELERAQNSGPTESVPLWSTPEPKPEWLRPGKCMQLRAHFRTVPLQSNLEPEQCRLGKHTPLWDGANPVWPRHCEHSPHMPVIFLCSIPPSPQHTWTREPK